MRHLLLVLVSFHHLPLKLNGKYIFNYSEFDSSANLYLSLTTHDHNSAFFNDIDACHNLKRRSFFDKRCEYSIASKYGTPSRAWTPNNLVMAQSKLFPDCKYQWLFDGINYGLNFLVYLFTIHQHSCHANVTLLGGSTFDIFAYNSLSTVSCSYADTRNNSYQVQCHMPCVTHKCIEEQRLHTQRHDCIQLTALLLHEHYDSFGEISLTTEGPALRTVLQDNQTYCMGTTASDETRIISVSEERHRHHSHSHPHQQQSDQSGTGASSLIPSWETIFTTLLPPGVRVYSGIWVTGPMLELLSHHHHNNHHHRSNVDNADFNSVTINTITQTDDNDSSNGNISSIDSSGRPKIDEIDSNTHNINNNTYTTLYAHKKMENLTAISLHTREHQLVNYTDLIISTKMSSIPPQITMIPPSELADQYSFLPQIHLRHNRSIHSHSHSHGLHHSTTHILSNNHNHGMSSYNNNNNHGSSNKTTVVAASTAAIAASEAIQDKKYTFMGSSHMRYVFDAVVEHYLGTDVLNRIERKHTDFLVANFTYDDNVYSESISTTLKEMCKKADNVKTQRSSHSSSSDHILFLQTGHWDLTFNGLRYTIYDHPSSPGHRLLNVLNDIFTGKLPCSGINHIVWMTAVPHSLCFSHKGDSECEDHRGHRFNANIRALNEFFLRGILSSYANTSVSSTTTTGTDSTTTATATAKRNRIGLSVIDAFSIVHPRLIFDENNEVICLNHFSCRLQLGNVMHTPGGAAVVQSVLSAMTMEIP